MKVTVYEFDAFTSQAGKGNPAGVVFDAGALRRDHMQQIAHQNGYNETVFILNSTVADVRLRYFTPGHEINLCGHATVGAMFALRHFGRITRSAGNIETNIGILPFKIIEGGENGTLIEMRQGLPDFVPFNGDIGELARSMGLSQHDIDGKLPIVFGSTGTWTLLVPIKNIERFRHMTPHNTRFPGVLHQMPHASLHPFSMERFDRENIVHARHFSSMYSGTVEDPVTGTASGVIAAYILEYMRPKLSDVTFEVHQGLEIGREGIVYARAKRGSNIEVHIRGACVFAREFTVEV